MHIAPIQHSNLGCTVRQRAKTCIYRAADEPLAAAHRLNPSHNDGNVVQGNHAIRTHTATFKAVCLTSRGLRQTKETKPTSSCRRLARPSRLWVRVRLSPFLESTPRL